MLGGRGGIPTLKRWKIWAKQSPGKSWFVLNGSQIESQEIKSCKVQFDREVSMKWFSPSVVDWSIGKWLAR